MRGPKRLTLLLGGLILSSMWLSAAESPGWVVFWVLVVACFCTAIDAHKESR